MKTVLVVDDEPEQRLLMRDLLESEGYKIHEATNGQGGIDILRYTLKGADLILTDLDMPNVNGFELLKWCKQNKPDLPVIVVSGSILVETETEVLKLGAARFIRKPFDIPELLASIDKALTERK